MNEKTMNNLNEFGERVRAGRPMWILIHGVIAGQIPTNTVSELISNGLVRIPTTEDEDIITGRER